MSDCNDCVHLRTAPWQAPLTGCYAPEHMKITQKLACLDQQQQPGDHREINRRGDCPQFEAKPARLRFVDWLMGKGA